MPPRSRGALLMRDYIHSALYSSAAPYFSKPVFASPAGAGGAALHFAALRGRSDYDARVAALYAASARGWLTPVELFAPWYSYAIARCVLARAPEGQPLRVYEVGGGTGAHARHFLDYVRAAAPARYARPGGVSYTILEISPQLCARQGEALEAAGHGRGVAASQCLDATRAHEHLHDARPCTVVALEVLDNLPHDKVVCLDGALHETWVEEEEDDEVAGGAQQQQQQQQRQPRRREAYRPLADPLIVETWQWMEAHGSAAAAAEAGGGGGGGGALQRLLQLAAAPLAALCRALPRRAPRLPLPGGFQWALHAPTGSLALLKALRAALPAHSLLLADFSHLPHPRLGGGRGGQAAAAADVGCHAPADALPGSGGPPWAARHLRGLTERPGGVLLASGPRRAPASAPLLVASKGSGGGERDHASYLCPPLGEADIFFPTDFGLLARMAGCGARAQASADFLRQHAQCERTRTQTGFNPMLETYLNTSFLRSGALAAQ